MTDSSLHGTKPAAVLAFPTGNAEPGGTGVIARLLASPCTNEFVRRCLLGTIGRDPLLAYHEAVTLVGMLELLQCEEAQAWLLPAMRAALEQDPAIGFAAALDIAEALKPAAALEGDPDETMEIRLPEPANRGGSSPG